MRPAPKPYPANKDSGVPWLGEVPEHWSTKPLKHWVRMNADVLAETTPPDHEFRYLDIGSVGTGMLVQKPIRLRFGIAPSRARRVVQKGDTIVSTVRTYLKAVYFVDEDADDLVCSTGFAVLRPRVGIQPKFVSYVARSAPFTDRVMANSVGIAYPAIAETRLGSLRVAAPPISEQVAIVQYLDYMDRRIRHSIRTKQKLIGLLVEQKQVIIRQAITGQIDVRTDKPYPAYKDSGGAWFKRVPEHWDVARLKTRLRRNDAGAWGADFSDVGMIVLRSTEQTIDGGWRIEAPARRLLSEAERNATVLRAGDLLVTKSSGSPAHIGKTSLVTLEIEKMGCGFSNFMQRLRPTKTAVPEFLWLFLNNKTGREQLVYFSSTTTGLGNLSGTILGNLVVPFPSVPEQEAICRWVDQSTEELNSAIGHARREIAFLKEYHVRLIADVATGKLDVRDAAVNLPGDIDESESPEDQGLLAGNGDAGDLEPVVEEVES